MVIFAFIYRDFLKVSSNFTEQAVASYGIGALTEMCGQIYLFGNKLVRNLPHKILNIKNATNYFTSDDLY
jgi:hypothetical protein